MIVVGGTRVTVEFKLVMEDKIIYAIFEELLKLCAVSPLSTFSCLTLVSEPNE